MAQIIQTTFQFKRGDAGRWNELNPILAEGEPGFELDTNKFKIGNGINTWEELPYKGEANIVNAQTRNNFPAQGNENVIYKAQDEKLLYQWNPNISEYEVLGTVEEPGSGNLITVDTELSASSMNPVANKVITMALQDRYTKQEVDTAIENTNKRINLLEGTTHFKGVYPNLSDETLNDNLYEFSAGDIFIVGNAEYICTTSGDLALLEKASYEKLGDVTAEVERISALEEKVGNEGNGEIEATGLYQAIANLENNKLDKTDIINTLDSTALDKPLSAAMGKELNSLIKELSTDVNSIKSIAKTSTSGLVDTYTITFTNNTTTTFTVTNGDDGTSVSVSSVTESTESGGENVVNFSDGNTLTVKNGKDGKAPVKGTDYWTEADKTEIKNYVNTNVVEKLTLGINPADGLLYIYKDGIAIGSGVEISGLGYVDVATNTIIINTSLGEGTYVVKYEMENGDPVYIGELVIDNSVRYTVTNNLTKCSTNNSVAQVIGGDSYTAVISPDAGYIVETITVLMGGNDITSTAVEGNTISIASVDGDIEITAVAVEQVVSNNHTITNNLTNCSNSNTTTEVVSGSSYSATISTTPAYALSTLKVLMGGTDISSSAITNTATGAMISISSVTENVTITATAVENLIANSINSDGTIFNTVGYQSGKSQSLSSGNINDQAGYNITGFIPVVANQTIRVKNIAVSTDNSRNNVVFYDSSFARIASSTLRSMFTTDTDEGNGVYSRKLNGYINTQIQDALNNIAYMRFSSTKIDSTSVIVIDKTII